MTGRIENLELFKKLRGYAQKNFPALWDWLVGYGWTLKVRIRLIEPGIFSQLRQLSANTKHYPAVPSKRVLFFQTRSNPTHLGWAGTLAMALRARGQQTLFLGCSRELARSCNNANHPEGLSESRCRNCYLYTHKFFELGGFDARWIGGYLSPTDVQRAEELISAVPREGYDSYHYKGLHLGKIARHSVGHYLRIGNIGDDGLTNDVYRRFLVSAILITDMSIKLLDEYDPDIVLMLGGLFMPEFAMKELAEARGKRVVVYELAMLAQDALMLQHNRAIDYDDREGWERYKSKPLSEDESRVLDRYLLERSQGRMSVINYWPEKEEDERRIRDALKLAADKPTAILFPNITWDSALFEKDVAFKGMFDWLDHTINYFVAHPEYQLVIRAHPAEVILPGSLRESVVKHIRHKFPALPENIFVVPPESKISSYTLMDMSHCGLSYASTTAIELGVRGVPVLVAGEVHYRRKGFTLDVDDAPSYPAMLDQVMSGQCPLSRETIVDMARKYAYFTFFRTSMPFGKVHCGAGDQPVFTYKDVSDLLPGKDRSLDIICNGIVSGTPFIYEQ